MRYVISLWLFILLSGCATTMNNYYTKTARSWQGGNVNALVKRWGMPEERITTPNGETLLLYKTQSYRSNGTSASPQIGVNFRPNGQPLVVITSNATNPGHRSMSLTCLTTFLATKQGVIKDVQIHDYGCYGSEAFAQSMGNPAASHKALIH